MTELCGMPTPPRAGACGLHCKCTKLRGHDSGPQPTSHRAACGAQWKFSLSNATGQRQGRTTGVYTYYNEDTQMSKPKAASKTSKSKTSKATASKPKTGKASGKATGKANAQPRAPRQSTKPELTGEQAKALLGYNPAFKRWDGEFKVPDGTKRAAFHCRHRLVIYTLEPVNKKHLVWTAALDDKGKPKAANMRAWGKVETALAVALERATDYLGGEKPNKV